jgi:hypothetical protein
VATRRGGLAKERQCSNALSPGFLVQCLACHIESAD